MAKLTLTIFDPIEIEIIGLGVFRIESLSSKMLGDLQKAISAYGDDPGKIKSEEIAVVMEKMLPGITKKQAEDLDIRHVVRIATFLAEQIGAANEASSAKN